MLKFSRDDLIATMKFAFIVLIIFLLPNKLYGPPGLEVLNPRSIWLFVTFISGIGYVGYVLINVIGPGKGIGLTGFLGGIASSTALTLNLAGRSKENEIFSDSFAMGIVLSWSVMFVRLYLICIFLDPSLVVPLAAPLLIPPIPGFAYALYLHRLAKNKQKQHHSDFSNPFNLLPAIKFGVIFTSVMFLANAVRVMFGDGALMACSFIGGAVEMDAVAFSLLDMNINLGLATRELVMALVLASFANTLTKGVLVFVLGAKNLRKPIAPAVALICATAAVIFCTYLV